MYYAQIDNSGYCIAISDLQGDIVNDNLIPIDTFDTGYIRRRYDKDTKTWTSETNYTAEEIMTAKTAELEQARDNAIAAGFDCDAFGTGTTLHYSLTAQNQEDLKLQYDVVKNGATQVLWRDDSKYMHDIYTAEEFLKVFSAGYVHVLQCKLKCDALKAYVQSLLSAGNTDGARAVNWDTPLPDALQATVNEQLQIQCRNAGISL